MSPWMLGSINDTDPSSAIDAATRPVLELFLEPRRVEVEARAEQEHPHVRLDVRLGTACRVRASESVGDAVITVHGHIIGHEASFVAGMIVL